NETYYGYKTFSELLEDAQRNGWLELDTDKRSRTYVVVRFGDELRSAAAAPAAAPTAVKPRRKRRTGRSRKPADANGSQAEAPAVWNTCMVFFQALLLAGYAYAHLTSSRLGPRRQARLHLAVLGLPLVGMALMALAAREPIHVVRSLAPQGSDYPFFGVIVLL